MTWLDAISKIIVGLLALTGVALGSYLGWKQFTIKREDEKQEKDIQLRIDKAIKETEERWQKKLDAVSTQRSEEGAQRFKKHAIAIDEINNQIKQNSKQIGELTELSRSVLESMDSLNKVVKASAESQRNANYDRILVVANKVLKSQKITITEKTNLKQLYNSWVSLQGENETLDPKITTIYEECMKFTPTPDID